mgnify:CR=1 FL=1
MRIEVLAFAIGLSACTTSAPAPAGPAGAQIAQFDARLQRGEALVAEIGAMYARDRLLREAIIAGFQDTPTAEARVAYIEGTRQHFDRVDGENTRRMRQIFAADTGTRRFRGRIDVGDQQVVRVAEGRREFLE